MKSYMVDNKLFIVLNMITQAIVSLNYTLFGIIVGQSVNNIYISIALIMLSSFCMMFFWIIANMLLFLFILDELISE